MEDFFIYWWLQPSVIILIALHLAYMVLEQTKTIKYSKRDLWETVGIAIVWPLGLAILMLIAYTAIHSWGHVLYTKWEAWRRK